MSVAVAEQDVQHGTPHAYKRLRCRCAECRAWKSRINREWRENHPDVPPGWLLAPCWCEARCRAVPASVIRAGRTWSCGAPDCSEET